uniref:Peptidase S1 domain-containing protein n=1 Tax=Amblyomma maculatum TaxID=34609 RepID=G3ML00_AMBMU
MCVPYDECKDDKATKEASGAHKSQCGPEQACCYHLIVRTEKTVETHSYLFPRVPDTLARKGEFPWQAVLFSSEEEFLCSGVIIGPKHVLSTADCVHKFQGEHASRLFVRLGVLDRNVFEKSPVHQNYTVEQVIVQPKFRSSHIRNVAVIKLREEVATTPTIGRIVLAEPEDGSFVGKHCVVSGWGRNLKHGSLSSLLTKANVSVVDRAFCQQALRKTKLGPSFKLDDGSICATGDDGAATCQGDDGGPLVCQRSPGQRPVLVGLVSYGELRCGELGVPAVYADVAKNMDFITQATALPRERFTKM